MVSQKSVLPQSETPALLVDAMLGTLARWLRLAGYDAEFWREGSDEQLIAAAQAQGRLILTKDHPLAGRRGVRALLISADDLDEQIAEARRALAALGPAPEPWTRCGHCNGILVDLARTDAEHLVPPYVWHTQTTFRRCARCGRVYWRGTHWPAVERRLDRDEGEELA